jgi:hypothetical protein
VGSNLHLYPRKVQLNFPHEVVEPPEASGAEIEGEGASGVAMRWDGDSQYSHSAASKIKLDKIAKEFDDQGERWSTEKAYSQLEVWSLENGKAMCTKHQVAGWRKPSRRNVRETTAKKTL